MDKKKSIYLFVSDLEIRLLVFKYALFGELPKCRGRRLVKGIDVS